MKQKVPVAKGEEIEVDIVDLAYGGDSISKYKDFTIFLPYGVPGSKVLAKIIEVKKNFASGKIIKCVKQSDIYNNPQCPYFGMCGGCDWLNIKYQKQVEYKINILNNNLSRIAGLHNIKIQQPITYQNPFYYRNRAQYKIKYENNKIKLGFFKARSHEIIAIEKCLIINDEINKTAKIIENGLNEKIKDISVYSETNKRGYLRYITIKINSKQEVLVTFVVTSKEKKSFIDYVSNKIINENKNVKGIVLNINRNEGNTVFGDREITVYGTPYIEERYNDICFLLKSASFFQINFFIYTKMVEYLAKNISNDVNLLDLYGGVGALTLPLKEKVHQITVVDNETSNIEMLKEICKKNNIKNIFPVLSDAENVIERILYERKIQEIVVDPPRKGLHPRVLHILKKSNVRNIIYISCNPTTFARDIMELKEKYFLKEVVPMDQFAHTYHIELMAKLERKRS